MAPPSIRTTTASSATASAAASSTTTCSNDRKRACRWRRRCDRWSAVEGPWLANDTIEAAVVIGAGGHFCPVARMVGRTNRPEGLIVAQEAELRLPDPAACGVSGMRPELYFCADLEGYGWCVRKGDYLNVGLGRREGGSFPAHVRGFVDWLERQRPRADVATGARWRGHAYLLAEASAPRCRRRRDADRRRRRPGLSRERRRASGRPSNRACSRLGRCYPRAVGARADLIPYEQTLRAAHPASAVSNVLPRGVVRPLGRWLLGNPRFTRHVVLDRWFLRSTGHARPSSREAA